MYIQTRVTVGSYGSSRHLTPYYYGSVVLIYPNDHMGNPLDCCEHLVIIHPVL